jgi:hypothetical protein
MFFLNSMFWIIVGLGLALPSTVTIVINIGIKLKAGDSYEFSLGSLFRVYLISLLGWAIFLSEVMG